MITNDRLTELERLLRTVRVFLEPHWKLWWEHRGQPGGQKTLSEGTCGRTSCFLKDLLPEYGFATRMAFGSPVECDCGYHTGKGWKGHCWVVVDDPSVIVDLTADQFGEVPVLIVPADDPRYAEGHDMASDEWRAERQRVARELQEDWHRRGGLEGLERAALPVGGR
ncbi:hypothetical protein [Rhodalgimonas zhirmunskyi]|uniref:Uncharacterized protein n=1 Tax=Rhodalgimonas zhirmunskyi TaxID=2964767 RepID=A0AAJ1X739_9RHOB|nr:hypothetical protein [Rhodoalgimonas zhirmunskyi]MDQ2094132.1 hypothetical protein [Rhodoalgimonas zhirmunskyi]